MKKISHFISILLSVTLIINICMLSSIAEDYQQLTELPAIYITLDNGADVKSITKTDKLPGVFNMVSSNYDNVVDAPITIKGRGNSTWTLPKKPYQIKFDSKVNLLGMGKAKKWILLANYWDKTLMRNAVTYNLANKINNIFSPEYRFVDVFINGEYFGNYLLTEKVELNEKRINESADNGAVLFELEQQYRHAADGCDACFITDSGVHVVVKEPEVDETLTQKQLNAKKEVWRQKLNAVESAIKQGYNSYSKLIDVQSFLDWYIENELAKNYDAAFVTSTYCYLDESGILHMGPVWDVDVCFGNQDVVYPFSEDNGLNYYDYRTDKGAWYHDLFADADFVQLLKARWKTLCDEGYISGMFDTIDSIKEEIYNSEQCDNARWPEAMRLTTVRENPETPTKGIPFYSFNDEVDYFKEWLAKRIDFLDSQFNNEHFNLIDSNYIKSADINVLNNVGNGEIKGDSWVQRCKNNNRGDYRVGSSGFVFKDDMGYGSYVVSVSFKYDECNTNNIFNLFAYGLKNSSRTLLDATSATRVTYYMSEKDENGYAKLNMKIDTSQTDFMSYAVNFDAYNSNVTINDISLYYSGEHVLGDVDCNNVVSSADALLTLQAAASKKVLTDEQKALANVTKSTGGQTSVTDALLILQMASGKIRRF